MWSVFVKVLFNSLFYIVVLFALSVDNVAAAYVACKWKCEWKHVQCLLHGVTMSMNVGMYMWHEAMDVLSSVDDTMSLRHQVKSWMYDVNMTSHNQC